MVFIISLIYLLVVFGWIWIWSTCRMIPSNGIELIKITILKKHIFFRILEPLNLGFSSLLDFFLFQTLFLWYNAKILSLLIIYASYSWVASFFCFFTNLFLFILNFYYKLTWIFNIVFRFENDGQLDRQLDWMHLIFKL